MHLQQRCKWMSTKTNAQLPRSLTLLSFVSYNEKTYYFHLEYFLQDDPNYLVIIYAHFFFFTYREDRYLLFITENYAALRILEHFLLGDLCEEKPLVLFGSRFPKDNELTKVIVIYCYFCHHIIVFMRLRESMKINKVYSSAARNTQCTPNKHK